MVAQLWKGEGHPFYIHIQIKTAVLLAQCNIYDVSSKVGMCRKMVKNLFFFSYFEMAVDIFPPVLVWHG